MDVINIKIGIKRILGFCLAFMAIFINYSKPVRDYMNIPNNISLSQEHSVDIGVPSILKLSYKEQQGNSIVNVETISEAGEKQILIQPNSIGETVLKVQLLGITLKDIEVTVTKDRVLIPSGQSIGVTMLTKGSMIVGIGMIDAKNGERASPGNDAGLILGDMIMSMDGDKVISAASIAKKLRNCEGTAMKLEIIRNDKNLTRTITPIMNVDDEYKLGLWIRDSSSGVGTMTFIDPVTDHFVALGHGINDIDTNLLIPIKEGSIFSTEIQSIHKGTKGTPGELIGVLNNDSYYIGNLVQNNKFGLYGEMNKKSTEEQIQYPVGNRFEVEIGDATILTTIDDEGVKEFDCRIIKIYSQTQPSVKSMVIEVIDEALLSATGGIVQGMSGSPILQNGKIIGAVTHVFLNDPSKGYGIFIEWMVETLDENFN